MSETVRLPVGFMTAQGGLFHYEELHGEPVAHYVEEDPAWPSGASSLRLRQDLYETGGDHAYVVHSVLEHKDRKRTVIGRVERFSTLAEVMSRYPSLARSAGYRFRSIESGETDAWDAERGGLGASLTEDPHRGVSDA